MIIIKNLASTLKRILQQAYEQKIATSFSLYVGFGHELSTRLIMHAGEGSDTTIYDLASLTKIIGTTLALAQARTDQKICLKSLAFPPWPHTTVASLLHHRSGLPAHGKFYEELKLSPQDFLNNRQKILAAIMATRPQTCCERVYSDLGFIALGWLLEQRLKKSLFTIFADAWRNFNIDNNFQWFSSHPLSYHPTNNLVAPTGFCSYRQTRVLAQVHDPNCYYMGGLGGHAGLFGDLASVFAMGKFFLDAYKNPDHETKSHLASFARTGGGFDKPSTRGSTRNFSPHAFGHFGYTGTSLWVDPYVHFHGLVIALLTNRVNCSSSSAGIYWLRLRIHDEILKHLR